MNAKIKNCMKAYFGGYATKNLWNLIFFISVSDNPLTMTANTQGAECHIEPLNQEYGALPDRSIAKANRVEHTVTRYK